MGIFEDFEKEEAYNQDGDIDEQVVGILQKVENFKEYMAFVNELDAETKDDFSKMLINLQKTYRQISVSKLEGSYTEQEPGKIEELTKKLNNSLSQIENKTELESILSTTKELGKKDSRLLSVYASFLESVDDKTAKKSSELVSLINDIHSEWEKGILSDYEQAKSLMRQGRTSMVLGTTLFGAGAVGYFLGNSLFSLPFFILGLFTCSNSYGEISECRTLKQKIKENLSKFD